MTRGFFAPIATVIPIAALAGGCFLWEKEQVLAERIHGEDPTADAWNGRPKRLEGEALLTRVVSDFVDRSAKDPRVGFDRGGKYKFDSAKVAKLKETLVRQIGAITGGPQQYEGDMKALHAGMKITDDEFDALADNLIWVLNKYKVPKDEQDELVGKIAGTRGDIVEVKIEKPAGG